MSQYHFDRLEEVRRFARQLQEIQSRLIEIMEDADLVADRDINQYADQAIRSVQSTRGPLATLSRHLLARSRSPR